MNKIKTKCKSILQSHKVIITYQWLITTFIGVWAYIVTTQIVFTNDGRDNDGTLLSRLLEFLKPSLLVLWVLFLLMLFIATLTTINIIKQKRKSVNN